MISAEFTSSGSPTLVAFSSPGKGEASLSQGLVSTNNPWPCSSSWQARPRGPRCDRSWLLVHTAPVPGSMGKGGDYFCCSAWCVCPKEQNPHPKKGNTAQHSRRTLPGCRQLSQHAHNAHAALGVVQLMLRVTPGLSRVLSSPLPAQE